MEACSTTYGDLNSPKIPSHKHEYFFCSSTSEESIVFEGPVKFWKYPLYYMVEEEGEGSIP